MVLVMKPSILVDCLKLTFRLGNNILKWNLSRKMKFNPCHYYTLCKFSRLLRVRDYVKPNSTRVATAINIHYYLVLSYIREIGIVK